MNYISSLPVHCILLPPQQNISKNESKNVFDLVYLMLFCYKEEGYNYNTVVRIMDQIENIVTNSCKFL